MQVIPRGRGWVQAATRFADVAGSSHVGLRLRYGLSKELGAPYDFRVLTLSGFTYKVPLVSVERFEDEETMVPGRMGRNCRHYPRDRLRWVVACGRPGRVTPVR